MKLLILEGIDRTGKNTLISNLSKHFDNIVVRHFGHVFGETNIDKKKNIVELYLQEFELYRTNNKAFSNSDIRKSKNDIWIWNRSHISEYVYGSLYRNSNSSWIFELEKKYSFDIDPNIYLVNLTGTPEFLFKQEDGNSVGPAKLEDKRNEILSFNEAVRISCITNKITITVDYNEKYYEQSLITNKVLNFIK